MPSFGKRTPFSEQHLRSFESCYLAESRQEGDWSFAENQNEDTDIQTSRWRCFTRQWITEQKGDSLDISWLKDETSIDAANSPEPDVLAAEAMSELTEALRELDGLMAALGAEDEAKAQKDLLAETLRIKSTTEIATN